MYYSLFVVRACRSVDMLHCRCAPGIGPVHLISALDFVGFSFPCVCVCVFIYVLVLFQCQCFMLCDEFSRCVCLFIDL